MPKELTAKDEERDDRHPDVEEVRPYAFPVRVQAVTTRAASLAALTAAAKEKARDPSIFDDREPFIFSAVVSTDRLDSYFTHMHDSSLKNFAGDMEEGVSLQNSHNTYQFGLGRSFTGRFTRKKGGAPSRTEGEFYMLPDSNVSGVNTTDVIDSIRAGVLFDMSVGFNNPRYVCDLCGQDYMRACPHWLGMEYGEEGEEKQTATAAVHDAGLSEVSLVFDGATPGAAVQKVIRAVEEGLLEPEKVRALEACYRVKLPGNRHIYPGFTPDERGARHMANDGKGQVPEPSGDVTIVQAQMRNLTEAVAEAWKATRGEEALPEAPAAVRQLAVELVELRPLRDEVTKQAKQIADLTPRAKDGDAYRDALIDQAWSSYVEAGLSENVDETEQRAYFAGRTLPMLRKDIEEHTKLRNARFPGGRVTTEGEAPPSAPQTPSRELPPAAYLA